MKCVYECAYMQVKWLNQFRTVLKMFWFLFKSIKSTAKRNFFVSSCWYEGCICCRKEWITCVIYIFMHNSRTLLNSRKSILLFIFTSLIFIILFEIHKINRNSVIIEHCIATNRRTIEEEVGDLCQLLIFCRRVYKGWHHFCVWCLKILWSEQPRTKPRS